MKPAPLHFCLMALLGLALATAEEPEKPLTRPDFLRFKNGDTMHGRYLGLDEGLLLRWQSDESPEATSYLTRNLRKLSLNGGFAKRPVTSQSLVKLSNGDLIPGNLIAMGIDSVSLQTEFAGLLTLPRAHISLLMPNHRGADLLYVGPFCDDGWGVPGSQSKANPVEPPEEELVAPEEKEDTAAPAPPKKAGWTYGGASWWSNSSEVLRLHTPLPDRVSIRFHLAWQAPLNANFAVFTDFQRPATPLSAATRVRRVPAPHAEEDAPADEELAEGPAEQAPEVEDKVDIMEQGAGSHAAESYGSGYLLSIFSNFSRLQRLSFDDQKQAHSFSFSNTTGRLDLDHLSTANFEIRADRTKGTIQMLVNGTFYCEWQDLADPLPDVKSYFAISAGSRARLRISDVVIAKWNGMPDSARSMESEERDVILTANGTDRLSGNLLTLEEDIFRIESSYGVLQVPMKEVTDIRLASNRTASAPDPELGEVLVSLQPFGLLTLVPKEGQKDLIVGKHPILGNLSLDLNYLYLLEFDPISSIFDNWDNEF